MRRGLSGLLILGLAATPLAWVPAASAAPIWQPEVTASDETSWVTDVALTVDPAGNATAVWDADVPAVGSELQTATRPAGAVDFGPVQRLTLPQYDLVDVVSHPGGAETIVVVKGGASREILTSTRTTGNGEFPGLASIPGSTGSIGQAVAAVDGSGAVTVVWETGTSGGVVMMASTRTPSTGVWSTPELVAAEDPDLLRVVASAGGRVTVAWTQRSADDDGDDLLAVSRPAGGAFGGVQVVDGRPSDVDQLQIAAYADGVTALAWDKPGFVPDPTVPDEQVQVAIRLPDEPSFDNPVAVPGSSAYDGRLAVEVDSLGQVITAWPHRDLKEMVVVTRAVDGTFSEPVDAGPHLSTRLLVSELDGNDALTLVWLNAPSGGTPSVFASRRLPGGSFSGAELFAPSVGYLPDYLDVAVAGSGDVTTAYDFQSAGPDYLGSRVLDVNAPSLSVSAAVTGATASLTAQASDVWSTPSIAWDFGDGQSGVGAATSHRYAASGSYLVRATASDAAGNSTSATTTVSVTVPPPAGPPPAGPPGPAVDRQAPGLSGVKVKPKVLPVETAARLLVTSSEGASLKGVVQRRRTNGKWRSVAKRSWSVETGANKEKLYGKQAQRKLAPGRYRVVVKATDKAGNVSAATTALFRVVGG